MTHTPGPWKVRPTRRITSEPDMFDIVADAPDGGTYIIAKLVRKDDARLIVELVNANNARVKEAAVGGSVDSPSKRKMLSLRTSSKMQPVPPNPLYTLVGCR